jgi:hypothetical protein
MAHDIREEVIIILFPDFSTKNERKKRRGEFIEYPQLW